MKKTELTKQAIIDSTIKILRKNGNVTVKEIALDANVNIAAINYHFTAKQNLIVIVVRRLISEFKSKIDEFLKATPESNSEVQTNIRGFLDEFYNFVFENLGIIKYILIPNNNEILEGCSKIFLSQFSMESETTYKIVAKLSESNPSYTSDELKIKYVLLFSAFAFPLIFQLDIKNLNSDDIFQINKGNMREIYIDQLTKFILN